MKTWPGRRLTPDQRAMLDRLHVCAICGKRSTGKWWEVDGRITRAPRDHNNPQGVFCIGSRQEAT